MPKILKNCILFFRRETVLCIAALLALLSVFFVPPSAVYISYIDWDTLALLFSLMAVMKGFQKAGLFVFLGNQLLKRTGTTRKMLLVLVFLPFVFSMVITNDVSLITFVPFGYAMFLKPVPGGSRSGGVPYVDTDFFHVRSSFLYQGGRFIFRAGQWAGSPFPAGPGSRPGYGLPGPRSGRARHGWRQFDPW